MFTGDPVKDFTEKLALWHEMTSELWNVLVVQVEGFLRVQVSTSSL